MLAAAALGTVLAGAGADSAAALWQSVSRRPHLSRGLLRWELGDLLGLDGLSAATVLALGITIFWGLFPLGTLSLGTRKKS